MYIILMLHKYVLGTCSACLTCFTFLCACVTDRSGDARDAFVEALLYYEQTVILPGNMYLFTFYGMSNRLSEKSRHGLAQLQVMGFQLLKQSSSNTTTPI